MTKETISQFPAAATLDGTEKLLVDQTAGSGVSTRRCTTAQVARLAGGIYSVKTYGAAGDEVTDDTTAIRAAISAAASAGGGDVLFPPGIYGISDTLTVSTNNIRLVGMGGGSGVQVGQGNIRASAASRVLWIASAPASGTAMVKFVSPTGDLRRTGGGVSDLMLDGNTVCPVGLLLRSWIYGTFDRVTCYACTEDQVLLGVVDYALLGIGDPSDTQYNIFTNCTASTYGGGGWYLTTVAKGFRLTGGTAAQTGNTSQNTFIRCNAYMSKGDSYTLENCDTNGFFDCNGSAAYGETSGYSLVLCSADEDTGVSALPAADNRFFGGFFGTAICRAAKTGGLSSLNNGFYGYKQTVQDSVPVLDTGAGGSLDAAAISFTNEAVTAKSFNMAVKPNITGSRASNAALASLLTALAATGLITDGSS